METQENGHDNNILVLVIDDDSAVRDSLASMLKDFDYDVLTAGSGQEGLELFRTHQERIDMVFLDLIMPKMSGKKVLAELVKIDPEVKVVVISGSLEEDHGEDLSSHIQQYLLKPFELETIDEIVRSTLGLK